MANGCEFVCNNKDCKNYQTGIVITAPWPLGEIDKVIEDDKVKKDLDFHKHMIDLRDSGRKYACISFPNTAKIPIEGFRVHMWCEKCMALWNYDAMWDGQEKDMEEIIKKANIPENCPKCQSKTKSFADLLDQDNGGIICPSCNVKTLMRPFFCNEEPDETDEEK